MPMEQECAETNRLRSINIMPCSQTVENRESEMGYVSGYDNLHFVRYFSIYCYSSTITENPILYDTSICENKE